MVKIIFALILNCYLFGQGDILWQKEIEYPVKEIQDIVSFDDGGVAMLYSMDSTYNIDGDSVTWFWLGFMVLDSNGNEETNRWLIDDENYRKGSIVKAIYYPGYYVTTNLCEVL